MMIQLINILSLSLSLLCTVLMMTLIERRPFIPLLLAFILVQPCMLPLIQASITNFTDESALLAFKSKLSPGPNETVLAGDWSPRNNFCHWIGVSCSRGRQRVASLNLSYMGLEGTISPHIGNLSFLVSLDLSHNNFFDFVPHEINRLHRLRILRLSSNSLEGSVPPTLDSCLKLQEIDLSRTILWVQSHLLSAICPRYRSCIWETTALLVHFLLSSLMHLL
jgi:LRR receptor-like serine/threonine-protein kinase FLS2